MELNYSRVYLIDKHLIRESRHTCAHLHANGPGDTLDPALFTSSIDYIRGRLYDNNLIRLSDNIKPGPELAEEFPSNPGGRSICMRNGNYRCPLAIAGTCDTATPLSRAGRNGHVIDCHRELNELGG